MLAAFNNKRNFEQVFQLFSSGLIFIDNKGEIVDINSQMEVLLDTKRDELIGINVMTLFELLNSTHHEKKEFMIKLSKNGQAYMLTEIQTFKGELKYIQLKVTKELSTDLYLVEVIDESEKMYLKKCLAHNESLSTIGQLAASIAHEIRNPMTSLKGFTQLLDKTTNDDGKRYLAVINDEIKRMEEILTEFLQVSKPTEYKKSIIDMKLLMQEVVNFMAPQALMQHINISTCYEVNSCCNIDGDRNLLKQVLINSIKNAIEVMPNGGDILIKVTNTSDNQVITTIQDQGYGIEEENLLKIFDPFFTTKETGTGLGLAHAFQVVEKHEGKIEVESTVGVGTTFHFIFPQSHEIHSVLTI